MLGPGLAREEYVSPRLSQSVPSGRSTRTAARNIAAKGLDVGFGRWLLTAQAPTITPPESQSRSRPVTWTSCTGVTQGWPAGVRMALLATRAGRSPRLSLDLVHDDSLAEYLSTEVLSSLDDEMRDFVAEATVDEMVSLPRRLGAGVRAGPARALRRAGPLPYPGRAGAGLSTGGC